MSRYRITVEFDSEDLQNFMDMLRACANKYYLKVFEEIAGENRQEMIRAYSQMHMYDLDIIRRVEEGTKCLGQ